MLYETISDAVPARIPTVRATLKVQPRPTAHLLETDVIESQFDASQNDPPIDTAALIGSNPRGPAFNVVTLLDNLLEMAAPLRTAVL